MPSEKPTPPLFGRIPNAVTIFLFVMVASNYFSPFTDLDWCWHVRTGQVVVETATLRHPDCFSYTIPGKEINDFEWLYEITLYGAWACFGMGGLKFLRLVLVMGTLAVLAWRLHAEKIRWHIIALTLIFAPVVVGVSWNLRPLFMTTLGLLVVAGLLQDHCKGRRPLPWWFPAILWIWANTHPGVIVGQALLLGTIGWEVLNLKLQWNPPLSRAQAWRLAWVGSLALLATCISPDPLDRLLYPFRPELRHPVMRTFNEMRPLWQHLGGFPVVVITTYAVALVSLYVLVRRFHTYRLWEVALWAGTALLANMAARGNQDWFLVMLILTIPRLRDMLVEAAHSHRREAWTVIWLRIHRRVRAAVSGPFFRIQWDWLGRLGVAFLVLSTVPPLCWHMPVQESTEWPSKALDFLEAKDVRGNFFCTAENGAYVGWRLKAKARIYTDTRGFFFPPMLIEDCRYLPSLRDDWRARLTRVLDEYPTEYFLLDTQGDSAKLWSKLEPWISQPTYKDKDSVVITTRQVREALAHLDADQRFVQGK